MNSDLGLVGDGALVGVRAKTSAPLASRSGQFPGVRRFRRSRWARVTGVEGRANCFHVMSRLTDGLEFFDETEKEALVVLIWKMAAFCKVKVLTYCVMGNHFHLLIEVPEPERERDFFRERKVVDGEELGWTRLYRHLGKLYSEQYVAELRAEVEKYRALGQHEQVDEIREAFLVRMADLSRFGRELKERFTRWCNRYRGRRGSLWQGKFKSVLVQGREDCDDHDSGYSEALRTMAAYIDLNPVRAGLVEDPLDYRWCGYAAACAGSKRARKGLGQIMGQRVYGWEEDRVGEQYRALLDRHGLGAEKVTENGPNNGPDNGSEKAAKKAGNLVEESLGSLSRGVAFGDEGFIEEAFVRYRALFGPKRERGKRRSGVKRLFSLRQVGK